MKDIINLFKRFFYIGATTFGGGYSMLPMMERELCIKENWITKDELLDYFAISQCMPGIIAINTATFVGYKVAGAKGAAMATVGVVLPSLMIITLIAAVLNNFIDAPAVRYALYGIKIAVAGLIITAVAGLMKSGVKKAWGVIAAAVAFLCGLIFKVSPVVIVPLTAFAGIVFEFIRGKNASKGGNRK